MLFTAIPNATKIDVLCKNDLKEIVRRGRKYQLLFWFQCIIKRKNQIKLSNQIFGRRRVMERLW